MAHGRISSPVDGRTVRTLREHRGWNLRKLAGLSGVSASEISRIEREKSRPRPATMLAIADALGVTSEDLCKHTEEMGEVAA